MRTREGTGAAGGKAFLDLRPRFWCDTLVSVLAFLSLAFLSPQVSRLCLPHSRTSELNCCVEGLRCLYPAIRDYLIDAPDAEARAGLWRYGFWWQRGGHRATMHRGATLAVYSYGKLGMGRRRETACVVCCVRVLTQRSHDISFYDIVRIIHFRDGAPPCQPTSSSRHSIRSPTLPYLSPPPPYSPPSQHFSSTAFPPFPTHKTFTSPSPQALYQMHRPSSPTSTHTMSPFASPQDFAAARVGSVLSSAQPAAV